MNAHGGFGRWTSAVSRHPGDIHGILEKPREARSGQHKKIDRVSAIFDAIDDFAAARVDEAG